jgi:hypothetical protein
LADKRNQRAAMAVSLWDKVKRIRNGIKGLFGDDSSHASVWLPSKNREPPYREALILCEMSHLGT